jgi:hypothetical protein
VPESWHWPVGVSLSMEFGHQQRDFSTDTWTWEIRPIVDQKIGRWYWAFNPAVEKSLKGDNAGKGFSFTPAAKVSYDVTSRIAAALEYYCDLGKISHIDPPSEQQHMIFPVLDIDLGPRWELNVRVGVQGHAATDRLIVGDPWLPVRRCRSRPGSHARRVTDRSGRPLTRQWARFIAASRFAQVPPSAPRRLCSNFASSTHAHRSVTPA